MYDGGKIALGLVVLAATVTFPVWYNQASGGRVGAAQLPPELAGKQCVAPREYMRDHHMELLNHWRNQVVRERVREWTGPDGKVWKASLTKTCLNCHTNKAQFCDSCHKEASVKPACWNCHVDPKGDNL